jgi:hypothetical protein
MKKQILITTVAIALASTTLSARWGHHGHHGYHSRGHYNQSTNQTAQATLTQEQKENLTFMYQEEKLARDVYITLGKLWNQRVFTNIQRSEQRHMNSVKYLLNRYNLPVPVLSDDIGVFENEELQELYNQLIAKGKSSLKDALEVGVTIEEVDIADLEAKTEGAPSDIQRVFKNLLRGSYNHLRAFNRSLGNL